MSTNSGVENVGQEKKKKTTKKFVQKNTFFNWAQLFAQLSVTVVIAVYAIVQDNRDRQIAYADRQQGLFLANETRTKDLFIAESNRLNDILLADDQQKENILSEYQNFMSDLLFKYGIILNDTAARFVGRFKTLAALEQLNPARRTFLIRSLVEAQLVTYDPLGSASLYPIIDLSMANLTEIDLSITDETIFLPKSDRSRCLAFDRAILNRASFHRRNLSGSTFINARLDYADFSFSSIDMLKYYNRTIASTVPTIFQDAHMNYANFYRASFSDVDFTFAQMIGVNMSHTIQVLRTPTWKKVIFIWLSLAVGITSLVSQL